jgi:hypothetical protein
MVLWVGLDYLLCAIKGMLQPLEIQMAMVLIIGNFLSNLARESAL